MTTVLRRLAECCSFDIDLPVECDDEYWMNDDPDLEFKQPPGKPSTVSMFVHLLRLGRILAHAYRTIVSIFILAHIPAFILNTL